jgi:hypothetical protein
MIFNYLSINLITNITKTHTNVTIPEAKTSTPVGDK